MKPATQKKLTKRQLKAARGPNAAVMRSIGFTGVEHPLYKRSGGRIYTGSNPEYANINGVFVKVRSGAPFVRFR